MQDNIITWNLENWITITLMAAFGFAATGALMAFAKGRKVTLPSLSGNQAQQ